VSKEQNEHEEQQDFEAAFNEEEPNIHEGDTEQAAEDLDNGDNEGEVNDTDLADDSEGEPDDDTEDQAQDDSEDTGNGNGDSAQADDDLADVLEEDKPRAKSWEGRLKKREEELKRREDELKLEQEPATDETADDDGESVDEFEPEDGSEIAEVLGDFPELADPIAKIISKEVKKATEAVRNEFQQQLDPVTQQLDESKAAAEAAIFENHFATITEQHPDFSEIVESDALGNWIDNLPHREAVKYERVRDEGTAVEVVEMLSRLKLDRQKESKKDALNQRRNKQKQAGQVMPKHSSKVDDKKGKVDMNDFDAGFEDD